MGVRLEIRGTEVKLLREKAKAQFLEERRKQIQVNNSTSSQSGQDKAQTQE